MKTVHKAQKRARNQNREALLEPTVKQETTIPLTCVTTYNSISTKVAKIIQANWRILTSGKLQWEKPLFSYKRSQNLQDSLVSTRPRQNPTREATVLNSWGMPNITGHYACGNCSVCHLTKTTKNLNLEQGKIWHIRKHTNCNSANVIYMITGPCGLRYIGMTSRKVKTRICEHRSNIRCKRNTTKLTDHFLTTGHTTNDMTWVVIEQLESNRHNLQNALFEKEQSWVYRLWTHVSGLNDDVPWNSIQRH